MSLLLAPILFQIVTLGVSDRAEGRYVIDQNRKYFDTSNGAAAAVGLSFEWQHTTLSLGYAPSLTITPLLESPREILLDHSAGIQATHSFRRTSFGAGVTASYGARDFAQELISPRPTVPGTQPPDSNQQPPPTQGEPQPGEPTPPDTGGSSDQPGTGTNPAQLEVAHLVSVGVNASASHRLSRELSWGASAGYTINRGVDPESLAAFPLVRAFDAGTSLGYEFDARNSFTTSVSFQLGWSPDQTVSTSLNLAEGWAHRFNRRTSGSLGIGVSYTATNPAPENWLTRHSIYPTGNLGISYSSRLARGTFGFNAGVAAAPSLDITTAVLDPRLSAFTSAGWNRDRLSLRVGFGTGISFAESSDALHSLSADAGFSYELGAGFTIDGGVREAWQRFGEDVLVNPTTVFYVGVGWSAATEFGRRRRR